MDDKIFSINEKTASLNVTRGLKQRFNDIKPVVVCVGTDITIGDSLGPIVGSMLKEAKANAFIYGTLDNPVTAKQIRPLRSFLSRAHKGAKILVVDAAVGRKEDVGTIKISSAPIRPGLGANKILPEIGDVNLLAIIAEKSAANYSFLNLTRLAPVFKAARVIADGIMGFIEKTKEESDKLVG